MGKGKKITGIVLCIFGQILTVGFFAMAIFLPSDNRLREIELKKRNAKIEDFTKDALMAEGTVTIITEDGDAVVEYYSETDGRWYAAEAELPLGAYEVGDPLTVFYKPDDPVEIMIPALVLDEEMPDYHGNCIMFSFFGSLILLVGIWVVISSVSDRNDQKWVEEIKARNAQYGIGQIQPGQPFYGNDQQPGAPCGADQQSAAPPYGGYQQPGGQPYDNYGQPCNYYGQQAEQNDGQESRNF